MLYRRQQRALRHRPLEGEDDERLLRPYDLASRLSYALWAGPPDEALLAAAADGSLGKPDTLEQQVIRMLKDERSAGFVEGFLDSWLNLREIGNQPPPRQAARVFYAEEKLADLYDLPEEDKLRLADGFQRVSLGENHHRGGVLGMAGVLTVSANGVETSPVTRGVWVSENILGVMPPPPPDEVPEIESDVSGATTIRERLLKHAADKTCAECHHKIDPLGFGLETFDPIGRWRTKYPAAKKGGPAPKIDASGEFPSGETYVDFGEFKKFLAEERKDLFARHLTAKLLAYSTGRHMEVVDDYEIEDILERLREKDYGLNTLVVEVLTSEIFRSR